MATYTFRPGKENRIIDEILGNLKKEGKGKVNQFIQDAIMFYINRNDANGIVDYNKQLLESNKLILESNKQLLGSNNKLVEKLANMQLINETNKPETETSVELLENVPEIDNKEENKKISDIELKQLDGILGILGMKDRKNT